MWQEFREFAFKGNAFDLAIGVIIGVAFGKIVDSIVSHLIMPIVGAVFGGLNFDNYFLPLASTVTAGNLADARYPLTELVPDSINGETQGGNRPESSNHHTSLHGLLSLHYFLGWPSRTIQAVHVECESVYDVRTCALYTDRALQYSMGVSRYQQLSHRKGYIWDRV